MDELAFKRINKRLDEIDKMILDCIKTGKHVYQSVIEEHKELSSKHDAIVSESREKLKGEFLDEIKKENN